MPETILDVGCGSGRTLDWFGVTPEDTILGVDIDRERVQAANLAFPKRKHIVGRGEDLTPFPAEYFTRVVGNISLPYMNIPQALSAMYRVLTPGGKVSLTIHPLSFTLKELRNTRHPKAFLFRLYVLLNGVFFYLFGRTIRLGTRTESFQTERGMRLALERCGFVGIHFETFGPQFFAEATKRLEQPQRANSAAA